MKILEFIEEQWYTCQRAYHDLRCWFHHNFNMTHWKLVKESITSYPFDYSYFYSIQLVKLRQMYAYFNKSDITEDDIRIAKDIKLAISLLEIFCEKRDLYHYEYSLKDSQWLGVFGGNAKYVCDVKVNIKNLNRFDRFDHKKIAVEKFPHELYIEKAKTLYFKILKERSQNWWN